MKNKKVIIIISVIVAIICIVAGIIIYINSQKEKPEDILNTYISLINEQKYEEMYEMISSESKNQISQEDFVKRNKNIYEGIDAFDIKISISEKEKENGIQKLTYTESMSTSAGIIKFTNTAKIIKEDKNYKLNWSSSMIFPELRNTDKVRVSSITAKRGEILDRNDVKLAQNGTENRVYPFGEMASHLIGYVQSINADELKEKEGKGYNSSSVIGKTGLEQAYEDTLRGIDGTEIYIVDENGTRLKTLALQEKRDGTDVKLTIDSNLQRLLYNELKEDKGFFVVMEPKTGELLACVSTPSYDPNDFVLGLTNSQWEKISNDENKPLYNKFLQSYCPGSTFKPITAAIGLTTGKLTTDTTFSYSGLKWQKDSSWGNDYITTLTEYSGAKNISNALIHSDNIFFGQAAMQIGSKTFCENLDKLGFNEQIEFPLTLKKSQYSNSDKKISTEKKLADSGYGQGDILVNPIHMASIYSAFANSGNMVKPYIEYNDGKTVILKENVFSAEASDAVKEALIQVVENPEGTANDMRVLGDTIAGKTGTAELKTSSTDTESGTLGWFNCFTIDNNLGKDMLIISMVENTQNNRDGGSHYLIRKIKTLFIK